MNGTRTAKPFPSTVLRIAQGVNGRMVASLDRKRLEQDTSC
jgi:hypothetical protein